MRERLSTYARRSLLLLPIPLLFAALSLAGGLQELENMAMDWRFHARGPIATPSVPLIYVNMDEQAIEEWGQESFPRSVHAKAARAALEQGGADLVFYDVIFSPITNSKLVPMETLTAQDEALSQAVRDHPNRIVLASAFSGIYMQTPTVAEGEALPESVRNLPPLRRNGTYDPALNPVPEMPGYPIYNALPGGQGYEGQAWGRTAVIDIAYVHGSGGTMRWVPAYFETANEYYSREYLHSVLTSLRRNPGGMQLVAPYAYVDAPTGADTFSLRADYIELGGQLTPMDTLIAEVPAIVPRTFVAASIEMILIHHGLDDLDRALQLDPEGRFVDIRDYNNGDALLHRLPLVDEQLLEINWFSPWATPGTAPEGTLGALDEAGFEARAAAQPPEAIRAMQLMRQAEVRGLFDPYNPRISLYNVVNLYDLAYSSTAAAAIVDPWMRQHFEGRIVLIGATNAIMQDVGPTPMDASQVPRVSAHGNMVKMMLTSNYIHRLSAPVRVAILLLLTVSVTLLMRNGGRYSRVAKIGGGLLLAGYIASVFVAFTLWQLVLPLIAPVSAAAATTAVGLTAQLLEEEKRRARIKGMFSTYLAPKLVDRMVESGEEPRLGGHSTEITALFSDIQGFSSFSELLPPAELTVLINEYLTPMTEILQAPGGYVDKYIGDAIVAMFNDPVPLVGHAYHACVAAARMQQMQMELRARWAAKGDRWPPLVWTMRTRIGINTGEATVGNMGSESRFNYTMIGDTVNLAARCESGAKSAGVYTLVTGVTRAAAQQHGDDVVFRFVDRWKVKGRSQPVEMYEIMGLRDTMSREALECRDIYEEALRLYMARDFAAAMRHLERSLELEPYDPARVPESPTSPSRVLLERCRLLIHTPPPDDWDGVFVMKTK